MNPQKYKYITSLWNVKRRSIIEDTIALINNADLLLIRKLQDTLESNPIEKPIKHKGGKETDYFMLLLTEDEMQKNVDILFGIEAGTVPNKRTK